LIGWCIFSFFVGEATTVHATTPTHSTATETTGTGKAFLCCYVSLQFTCYTQYVYLDSIRLTFLLTNSFDWLNYWAVDWLVDEFFLYCRSSNNCACNNSKLVCCKVDLQSTCYTQCLIHRAIGLRFLVTHLRLVELLTDWLIDEVFPFL
jgi:hypothetical protein